MKCHYSFALNDERGYYIINTIICVHSALISSISRSIDQWPSITLSRRDQLISHFFPLFCSSVLLFNSCFRVCRPTPKVEWKKKDGSLDETSGQLESYNRWLHFGSITQEDDGEYECRATNSHGSITHSFTVTVEGRPPTRGR